MKDVVHACTILPADPGTYVLVKEFYAPEPIIAWMVWEDGYSQPVWGFNPLARCWIDREENVGVIGVYTDRMKFLSEAIRQAESKGIDYEDFDEDRPRKW